MNAVSGSHKENRIEGMVFSVAPMMAWTDRFCRVFHRLMSRHAILYSEMVTTGAVIHGERDYILGYDEEEHPLVLQLGDSDPQALAEAARIAVDYGYDEINLNVGCPSDRVQSGRFGACLMAEPDLVARCVVAMKEAVDVPVTVKHRIGIDDQDSETDLDRFVSIIAGAGVDGLTVHARKAWLKGLSPKENRDIPPLDYDRVYRVKEKWPDLHVSINGGIETLEACKDHLERVDGVMLGRAAYHNPSILLEVDQVLFGDEHPARTRGEVVRAMLPYIERQLQRGCKLSQITRHMLGLYQGVPGARAWRRILTVESVKPGAGPDVLEKALHAVDPLALGATHEVDERDSLADLGNLAQS